MQAFTPSAFLQGSAGQHREAAWDGKHCMLVSRTASAPKCPQRDSANRENEYLWEEAVREKEGDRDRETERREKEKRGEREIDFYLLGYICKVEMKIVENIKIEEDMGSIVKQIFCATDVLV